MYQLSFKSSNKITQYVTYTLSTDTLVFENITPFVNNSPQNVSSLEVFTGNTLLMFSNEQPLTIWRAVKKSYDAQLEVHRKFTLLLKCQENGIFIHGHFLSIDRGSIIRVRKKYLGLATQILIENGQQNTPIYWTWNHGLMTQHVDVAPDPYFEDVDDYRWAIEMASMIAKLTSAKMRVDYMRPERI